MKRIRVEMTDGLTTVSGRCSSFRYRRIGVEIREKDGTQWLIPWSAVVLVKVEEVPE